MLFLMVTWQEDGNETSLHACIRVQQGKVKVMQVTELRWAAGFSQVYDDELLLYINQPRNIDLFNTLLLTTVNKIK